MIHLTKPGHAPVGKLCLADLAMLAAEAATVIGGCLGLHALLG